MKCNLAARLDMSLDCIQGILLPANSALRAFALACRNFYPESYAAIYKDLGK